MTSPVSPVSGSWIPPVGPAPRAVPTTPSVAPDSAGRVTPDRGGDQADAENLAGAIGQAVSDRLGQLDQLNQAVADSSRQAAVGTLDSVSDFMIATAEAQLATEVTVAVRDRAITAFNDIMRMQI